MKIFSFFLLTVFVYLPISLSAIPNEEDLFACPGTIALTTQADIDNFTTNYTACTEILGSLTIGPSTTITNLNGLSGLTQIDGGLKILDNTNLTDMSGLSNLTTINFAITVKDNPNLTMIDLQNVGGSLTSNFLIENNPNLVSLAAPISMTSVGGSLAIKANPKLATLTGLENITSIGGGLTIANTLENDLPDFSNLTAVNFDILINDNANATSLNLQNVGGSLTSSFIVENNPELAFFAAPVSMTSVGGSLAVKTNPKLATLTGLENITSIGGGLTIANTLENDLPDFSNLTAVNFDILINNNANATSLNLQNVGGNLTSSFIVENNPELVTLAAPVSMTSVGGSLAIRTNPKLATLTGFENITSVGGGLWIGNTIEDEFPDFPNLATIGFALTIQSNSELLELPAFTNLSSLGSNLNITSNSKLCFCSIPPICTYLAGANPRTINNNKGYCLSVADAQQFCADGVPTTDAVTDKSICSSASIPLIPFTSSQPGMDFSWTNDNINIGLAASGAGDIPSFIATNAEAAPIEAEIVVNGLFNSCLNLPTTFKIKVNPCAISIADPCNCTNLMNIKNSDGLITHFHDVLTINTGTANQTITLTDNASNNFLNNSLIPVTNTTLLGMTDANGILKVDFFKAAGASGQITVNNGIIDLSFDLPACDANNCFKVVVPTMSQWGLFIFGLLLLNLGVFFICRTKEIYSPKI